MHAVNDATWILIHSIHDKHPLRHPTTIESAIRAHLTCRSLRIQEKLVHLPNVLDRDLVSASQASQNGSWR